MPKASWQNHLALILDEINMICLRLLETIDMRVSEAEGKTNNDIAILGDLAPRIIIRNFYQFLLVTGRFL